MGMGGGEERGEYVLGAGSASGKAPREEEAGLKLAKVAGKNRGQMRWDSVAGARSDGAAVMCWAVTRKLRIITIIRGTQGSARNNNISHLYKRPKWNPNIRSSCSKNLLPPAVNILLPNRETNESGPAQIPRHQFLPGSVSRHLDLSAICTLNIQHLIACKKSAVMGKREASLPAPSIWHRDCRRRLPWIKTGLGDERVVTVLAGWPWSFRSTDWEVSPSHCRLCFVKLKLLMIAIEYKSANRESR